MDPSLGHKKAEWAALRRKMWGINATENPTSHCNM